jgi:CRP/FNR family transcriptional regulator, cyclic AMP receptor protein
MDSVGSPKSVATFSAMLPTEDRALVESAGIVRKFAAGTPIMHEGDPSEHVLIIRSGCVKVVAAAPGGTQVVLGIRGPGDIVGELAGLDGQPRRGTVTSIDKVAAVVVPGSRFRQLLTERPALSMAVARVVSDKLAESDRYRLAVGTVGVAPALARLILDLAGRYGTRAADGALTLGLGLTQQDLADCLAVSARTVARTVAVWRRAGVLSTGRRSVVVHRPATLQAYAEVI